MRSGGLAANVLLAFISGLLTLCVAEVALRFILPKPKKMFRFNPRAIYELVPNAERSFTHSKGNGGHTVETRINSNGFRGEELLADPERRVVVYGDSFIQAEFSSREASFTGRLKHELERMCPGSTEVVNAGVVGYGPDQILRRLETDLPELAPDLVIVSIFADNDFGDLLRNKMFALSPQGELLEHPVKLSRSLERHLGLRNDLALIKLARKAYWHWLTWREVRNVAPEETRPETPEGNLPEAPEEARPEAPEESEPTSPEIEPNTHAVEQWLRGAQEEYESYVVQGDRTVRRIDYDYYDADISLMPDSDSARYKIRLMDLILKEIAATLAKASIDHLLMTVPSPIDVCEDYDFDVDQAKYPAYDAHALTSAVERSAETWNLPHVSLRETFAASDPSSLYFHHGNNHWNDRGQALAAKTVALRIARRYWPECQSSL